MNCIETDNHFIIQSRTNNKAAITREDFYRECDSTRHHNASSSLRSTSSSSEPSTPQPQESIFFQHRQMVDDYKIDKQNMTHIIDTIDTFSISDKTNTRHRTSLVPLKNTPLYPISRYLPQNQAVITTQDNWYISLSNDIASLMFSGVTKKENTALPSLIGKRILDFIDISHRPILLDKIVKRRDDLPRQMSANGNILICGDVTPILKQDGTRSLASLWLKEKRNENGSFIFIWIFEEVFQSSIKIILNHQNLIQSFHHDNDAIQELLGYHSALELTGKPIQQLIPHYNTTHKFFGCHTKLNAQFPVMLSHVQPNMIRVTSMPILSSLLTVDRKTGKILSCDSSSFSRHLFGYDHLDHLSLSNLVPEFSLLIACLERDQLLQHGFILNNSVCRDVLQSHAPVKGEKPRLRARHRDGTLFDIDLQIKQLDDSACAVWILFDRDTVLQRHGHLLNQSECHRSPDAFEATVPNVVRSKSINLPTEKSNKRILPTLDVVSSLDVIQEQRQKESPKEAPAVVVVNNVTSFSRPSFSSRSTDVKSSFVNPLWSRQTEYSAQSHGVSIQDYEIVDELGQGAYGLVKLAYLKSDPDKKRVVIKYVIKSRILVDCWTRDRKLGLIPAEIHVLHTLRKIPHINCSEMLDYFEDDDNYYVVMDLYGAGMDLFDYIEYREGGMTENEIRSIFRQIISAVSHLHNHRIVHRDIKDENVILDLKGGVRLIDFGSASYVKEGKQYETFVGTLDYAAPEILKGKTYTGPPQDIWACGTLLYTLIYRENPFYNIEEIMQRELRIPFVLSEESVDLIRKMLDRNVDRRLTVHQVLEHPWFHMK
ncbi:kinase-like domain-containing protein [Choanephora cucurbitarum]|nr:kinase-like domain-containing protein [Choanephora cucurbitarum]